MFIFPPNPPSQTEHVMNNLFQQQDLWLAYQCGNTTADALSTVWITCMHYTQQLKYIL